MLPLNVMRYGRMEDLPEGVELHAGPLALLYEQGDLRSICLGDVEVLRRIYVAVRDRNWGTVAPVFKQVQVERGDNDFSIRYEVENRQGEIAFAWRAEIRGEAGGKITFTMQGEALSTFMKNRIGFCVLHPASAAGRPCLVDHCDGEREEGRLPVGISSDQPVLPFANMSALTCECAPGVWVEVRLEGDIFEMEDQRNWTDASYKIFCTPLALPFPVEVRAGTRIWQRITVEVRDDRPHLEISGAGGAIEQAVRLQLNDHSWTRMPEIGLGSASHERPLSDREVQLLRALNLHHLRVDLAPAVPDFRARLERAADEARRLDTRLEIALLVSQACDAELAELRAALEVIRPPVVSWLVYPARENYQGGSPTRQAVQAVRNGLGAWLDQTLVVTGSNSDFIFLNRTQQPVDLVDAIAVSINPQVHAFDNLSLIETLEAQPAVVRSTARLAQGRPVVISPITLKPRSNPYATASTGEPLPGVISPQVDPRQMSLFGASWTLGSLAAMAAGGAASLTYYETTGWRGVMETEAGCGLPAVFHSIKGGVFPLYHVLRDAGAFAGEQAQPLASSRQRVVSGLALRKKEGQLVLLANLTADPQEVRLEGLQDSRFALRLLDETVVEEAMIDPEAYWGRFASQEAGRGPIQIHLRPYATAAIRSFGK